MLVKLTKKYNKDLKIPENSILKDNKIYEDMKNLYNKAEEELNFRKNKAWIY